MQSAETNNHSFIVRFWLEEQETAQQPSKWRGHITHVPSGERQHLEKPEAILEFIMPFLQPTPM